ncbi:acetyl-CoA C-acyltransferase, partial [Streptomyces sp. PRKS01-29]
NKVCLSGLAAVTDAARLLRSGEASIVVAGGQESMTNAPHILPGSRNGWNYGNFTAIDSVAHDGLTDAFDGESMGASTERKNTELGIGRTEQDEVAAASHQRAAKAQEAGVFDEEIVPVSVPQRKGDPLLVSQDEGVRANTTVETLSGLS